MDGFNHVTLNAGIAAHDPLPITHYAGNPNEQPCQREEAGTLYN